MATFDKITVNGVTKEVKDSGAVRFDGAQTLTDAQKQQARDNIGAGTGGGGTGAVRYDEAQSLTDAQKTTARGNIGAASEGQVGAKADKTTTVNGHPLSTNVMVTKGDVGLGNVDNTSDANKPVSIAQQAALDNASAYGEVGPVAIASIQDALSLNAESLVVDIEPVQAGSGDPSPDNVRPIIGWTGAKVSRTGKNLAPVNTFVASHDIVMTFVPNLPAGVYTYSYKATRTGTDSRNGAIRFVYDDDTYIQEYIFVDGVRKTRTFTLKKPLASIYIYSVSGSYSDSGNYVLTATDFQITLGSTATPYEPYQGDIYNITFPTEAGTVYGGTLDVVNGVLTVDRGNIASYSGELLPGAWISSMDVYTAGGTPTTGAQVVYELATPITYQLTPQQVTMLQGENHVWADCGDTTVGFWRDDSLSINKAITERAYDRQQGEALADKLDTTQSGLAIIVDGDTAAMAVPVGGYAYVKNNTHGLAEGLYTNTSSGVFPVSGGTADSTVFTSVSGGGLNDVLGKMIQTTNQHVEAYIAGNTVFVLFHGFNVTTAAANNIGSLSVLGLPLADNDVINFGVFVTGKGLGAAQSNNNVLTLYSPDYNNFWTGEISGQFFYKKA